MASLSELKSEDELEQWGIEDAIRQTEVIQNLTKASHRFEFITKSNKREVIPSTCSLQEFALTKHVMQLVSRPNSATYLLESVNYLSASNDFRKFICFIDTYPEPGKSELATLVFPVFVYFYLLLLQSGPSGYLDAKSFFKKNKDIFADEKSYDEVLNSLYSFKNWMDVKEDSYFKNFLECKYIIGLSPDVLCALRSFIESQAEEEGDKALLYVLHFHIYFQDNDEAEYIEHVSDELLTSVLERNEYESVDQEDAKSVSDRMNAELFMSLSKNSENEEVKLDAVSSSDLVGNRLLASLFKSSDSDNESVKLDDGRPDSELDGLLKELNLNHPNISTIVAKCVEGEISSMDFNEDETEIAYAAGNCRICIASLGLNEQDKRTITEDIDGEPSKRQRVEEIRVEVYHSRPLPQRKGSKHSKTPKNSKTLRTPKGSKRTQEIKSNDDETMKTDESSSQVRGIRQIRLPEMDFVYIVKYLPQKPCLLLAVCNTKVRLLNTKTGKFLAEYDINNGYILDIDINPTSQYFATANMDLVACLYNFDEGTEIQNFVGHISAVTTVKFHPNGIYLATGSEDCTLRLFDIESGLCVRKFSDYMSSIVTIAFSSDGKMISAGDIFGTVKVWNIKDSSEISDVCFGKEFETLGKITTLCFQSDSSLLMACNMKGECKLWDVRNPENMQPLNFNYTPLKIKFCKNGVWKIAFQDVPS